MDRERGAKVLVVSDDRILGDLIALSLNRHGFRTEQADLARAKSNRWSPSFGPPDLVIVDLEAGERADPEDVRCLAARGWCRPAPLLLAADRPGVLLERLGRTASTFARPADVGGIAAAARSLLARAAS